MAQLKIVQGDLAKKQTVTNRQSLHFSFMEFTLRFLGIIILKITTSFKIRLISEVYTNSAGILRSDKKFFVKFVHMSPRVTD